jgi:Fur family ferric uptake transcriptional regulator
MTIQKTFEKVLSDNRQSLTRPRQAVFDALQHHKNLTMGELIATSPTVNRASLYRTTEIFERFGIIVRIPDGWKYRLELGEAFLEHHHHATCHRCGSSIALPEDKELEKRLHKLATNRSFRLESHQIELIGLCENCQNIKHA